jgi:hypothetical protein
MKYNSLKARSYTELYALWRDYVVMIMDKYLENYLEDDRLEQMVMTQVGDQVVPKGADYAWAHRIVVSRPEMLTENLPTGGGTLLGVTLETIECKVVRDLLKEFKPTFERLREAHRTDEITPH